MNWYWLGVIGWFIVLTAFAVFVLRNPSKFDIRYRDESDYNSEFHESDLLWILAIWIIVFTFGWPVLQFAIYLVTFVWLIKILLDSLIHTGRK